MLHIFELQCTCQAVILNQLDEARILQTPIFLLIVNKYGVGLQAQRTMLSHRIRIKVLIIQSMIHHPIAGSLSQGMEIDIEFQVGAVLGNVIENAREALIFNLLLVVASVLFLEKH